ncbi:MAG: type II toxin-antitoxin system VapC family toxin [Caldilineaceae bacterium]
MAKYLIDTNHASPLVTTTNPLQHTILDRINQGHSFAICVPILAELLFGIGTTPRAAKNLLEWQRLSPLFPCFFLDEADAEVAANLQISLRRQGWQLETVDALIAAVALRNEFILLTTDKDFRAVPNLQTENWLTSNPI